jgi:hypothetical protein
MGSIKIPSVFLLHFVFIVSVLLKGINGQVNNWLNGHATFYGANQNPTSLGKSHINHFDMSMPAFFRIARQGNEGIVPVLYRR